MARPQNQSSKAYCCVANVATVSLISIVMGQFPHLHSSTMQKTMERCIHFDLKLE